MAAHGNEQVVKILEMLLEEARNGRAGYLIAMMVGKDQKPMGGWFGSMVMEEVAAFELSRMLPVFEGVLDNKRLPEYPKSTADRVCYNVPRSPMSFDFACWLINAEMTRRIEGAPAPLKVCFWFGRDGHTGIEAENRKQFFHYVVRPMLDLIGAVEDESAVDGRVWTHFQSRNIVDMAKAGFEVPNFRAPAGNLEIMAHRYQFRKPVTITLREAGYDPLRNSNMDAWLRFANYLKNKGEKVVFVRDTAQADVMIDGFDICNHASLGIHWRLALYESAKMNFFVSNGPAALCQFSDVPWLMFNRLPGDDHSYEPNTPAFWREHFGIEIGTQFPWSRPADQRIIWAADDYENLVDAWETHHDRETLPVPQPALQSSALSAA